MTEFILPAVLVLGIIGAIFGILLYFIAQKFKVVEDPKIDEIADVLPGANCGGQFTGRHHREGRCKEREGKYKQGQSCQV